MKDFTGTHAILFTIAARIDMGARFQSMKVKDDPIAGGDLVISLEPRQFRSDYSAFVVLNGTLFRPGGWLPVGYQPVQTLGSRRPPGR
jgi:hypothetical protein